MRVVRVQRRIEQLHLSLDISNYENGTVMTRDFSKIYYLNCCILPQGWEDFQPNGLRGMN